MMLRLLAVPAILAALVLAVISGSSSPAHDPPSTLTSAAARFDGATIEDFDLNQSAPEAITEVPDPAGSGQTVFEMTVGDHDVYPITPTENPRAELLTPNNIRGGEELWWRAKFLLPGSFPAAVPGWLTLMQGPYGPPFYGPPPWHLEVNGRYIQWPRNGTYGYDVPWRMPLVRGRWIHVLVHTRFARRGFVEMWIDGRRVTFFDGRTYDPGDISPTRRLRMSTKDDSNDGGPNFAAVMSYRKRGMFPSVTIYQGPTMIGPTRASVSG
jgi:hypothetical protein